MHNNKKLNYVKNNPQDEYYTTMENAMWMVDKFKDVIKDHHIICPCDTNESNIVKALKESGISFKSIYVSSVNENDWLSDKMLEMYRQKDTILITNPPFSQITKFINLYKEKRDIKFILYIGLASPFNSSSFPVLFDGGFVLTKIPTHLSKYYNPNGELVSVPTLIFNNLTEQEIEWQKRPTLYKIVDKKWGECWNLDRSREIPMLDASIDKVAVPISYWFTQNHEWEIKGLILDPIEKESGRALFKRLMIERKK